MWEFNDDRPIYIQLMEQIQLNIISGTYPIGQKLPSVREFACEASVNPNTVQKALSELEKTNLIFSQRTNGRFVTEDIDMIKNMKNNLAKEQITIFLNNMVKIGYNKDETIKLIQNCDKEMK